MDFHIINKAMFKIEKINTIAQVQPDTIDIAIYNEYIGLVIISTISIVQSYVPFAYVPCYPQKDNLLSVSIWMH